MRILTNHLQSLQAVTGLHMYDKLTFLLTGEMRLITLGTGQNRPWILGTLSYEVVKLESKENFWSSFGPLRDPPPQIL